MKAAPMGKNEKSSNSGEGQQHNQSHRPMGTQREEAHGCINRKWHNKNQQIRPHRFTSVKNRSKSTTQARRSSMILTKTKTKIRKSR